LNAFCCSVIHSNFFDFFVNRFLRQSYSRWKNLWWRGIKMRVIQFSSSLFYRANNALNCTGSLCADASYVKKKWFFRNGRYDAPRGVEIGERVPIVSWPLLQIQYPPSIHLPTSPFFALFSFLFLIHLDVTACSHILAATLL